MTVSLQTYAQTWIWILDRLYIAYSCWTELCCTFGTSISLNWKKPHTHHPVCSLQTLPSMAFWAGFLLCTIDSKTRSIAILVCCVCIKKNRLHSPWYPGALAPKRFVHSLAIMRHRKQWTKEVSIRFLWLVLVVVDTPIHQNPHNSYQSPNNYGLQESKIGQYWRRHGSFVSTFRYQA